MTARFELSEALSYVGHVDEALQQLDVLAGLLAEHEAENLTALLTLQNNRGALLERAGRTAEALRSYLLAIEQSKAAGSHVVPALVLSARNNCTVLQGHDGGEHGAVKELRSLVLEATSQLGPADPITLRIRNNLAAYLRRSGQVRRPSSSSRCCARTPSDVLDPRPRRG